VALILFRLQFTEKTKRVLADPKARVGRLEMIQGMVGELGFEFVELCRSLSTGEIIWLLRGSADNVILVQELLERTGAYERTSAEILETVDTIRNAQRRIEGISENFRPPDQDEIDRMLLEE
tara:strand:- start:69 stop:434 length:366 start_codon:yes stop_codon:yes gene_type:complete